MSMILYVFLLPFRTEIYGYFRVSIFATEGQAETIEWLFERVGENIAYSLLLQLQKSLAHKAEGRKRW